MLDDVKASPKAPVRIALWGAGVIYRAYEGMLLDMQGRGEIEIVAIADSDTSKVSHIDGIPLVHPDELADCGFQYVVIMNRNQVEEITRQASMDCGIESERLLTYGILRLPGFDFPRYQMLRSVSPSIVSNSSWGAAVFRALQMDPRTPFVGTRVREGDFLRLLNGFDDYLAERTLVFQGRRLDAYGRRYISARVGDVSLRFFEPHTEESAAQMWSEGCSRMNRQFTIVQMSTLDPVCERRFDALTGFSQKFCFVPYETDVASSIRVPIGSGQRVFELSVEHTAECGLDGTPYDVLGLLLGRYGIA